MTSNDTTQTSVHKGSELLSDNGVIFYLLLPHSHTERTLAENSLKLDLDVEVASFPDLREGGSCAINVSSDIKFDVTVGRNYAS